jgi:hypothetical protein
LQTMLGDLLCWGLSHCRITIDIKH